MKIAVGLSGGVDSSVAAALLKEQGHQVMGLTMKVWDNSAEADNKHKPACIGPAEKEDLANAAKVADQLQIPFQVIDLSLEYKETILTYFTREYLEGKTPNPCVYCNQKMKFGLLIEKALASGLDFDYFATGHYARIEYDNITQRYILAKARYLEKDQSYFLSLLSQQQLARVLFPLSHYTKQEVRALSAQYGLITAHKPESQDFYSGDYAELFPDSPGEGAIVDTDGKQLGTHKGIIHYTIGQRRGLGISYPEPLYVVAIDHTHNRLIVGTEDKLLKDHLIAKNINWVSMAKPEKWEKPLPVQVKIRYMHAGAEAEIEPAAGNRVRVNFYQPLRAVTPGQIAVFYQGDRVLGAGEIEKE